MARLVAGLLDTMCRPAIVNVDFADLVVALSSEGPGVATIAEADANDYVAMATGVLDNVLWEALPLTAYRSVFLTLSGSSQLSASTLDCTIRYLQPHMNPQTNLILGATVRKDTAETRLTLVASKPEHGAPVRDEGVSVAGSGQQISRDGAPAGYDAFISYRRDMNADTARLIRKELQNRGYRVFLDVDDLKAHYFDKRLLDEIERSPNFIVILVPGSLERCDDPDDWLRREIAHAIATRRNIIPILKDGFRFPKPDVLPADMRELARHNGVVYDSVYFDSVSDKLVSFLCTEGKLMRRNSGIE
jgi:hypothetical protein